MNIWKKTTFILLFFSFLLVIVVFDFNNSKDNNVNKVVILKDYTKLSSDDKNIILNKYSSLKVDDNYLFLGDSITSLYNLEKYYPNMPVVNSGVSGNKTYDILNDMNNRVYKYNPSKIFLLIGTNQLDKDSSKEVYNSIKEIIENIEENRKYAKIYVESIYPVNGEIKNSRAKFRRNDKIREINKLLKQYSADNNDVTYIDLYSKLIDDNGNLNTDFTNDGLHINEKGYKIVTDVLNNYI